MLERLRDFLRRRRLRKRWIFPYHDGSQRRYGDPLGLWRAIVHNEAGLDVPTIAPLADAGQEPELSQWLDLLATAFQVERFDTRTGRGLTDNEILDLFVKLDAWIEEEKKRRPALGRPGGDVRPAYPRPARRARKKL